MHLLVYLCVAHGPNWTISCSLDPVCDAHHGIRSTSLVFKRSANAGQMPELVGVGPNMAALSPRLYDHVALMSLQLSALSPWGPRDRELLCHLQATEPTSQVMGVSWLGIHPCPGRHVIGISS